MRVDTDEPEIIERVAALDVAKAEVVCCARVPGPGRQRMQEVRTGWCAEAVRRPDAVVWTTGCP